MGYYDENRHLLDSLNRVDVTKVPGKVIQNVQKCSICGHPVNREEHAFVCTNPDPAVCHQGDPFFGIMTDMNWPVKC